MIEIQFFLINLSYCLFLDESNNFYLANLHDQRVKCIQNELKFDSTTTKAFRLISSNTHEQFIFGHDKDWLNGYDIMGYKEESLFISETSTPILFAFYTQKRNEIFVVEWDLKRKLD